MYKVALIGCGNIARTKHALALAKQPDVELVGFFDLSTQAAEALAKEFGSKEAKIYQCVDDVFEDSNIDIVHICTPNNTHAEYSIRAMRGGKHVMCEKPMATTVSDAEKMVRVSEETGKQLSVSYQHRYRTQYQFLKKEVDSGKLGEIYYAKAHAVRRRGVPTWGNFLDKQVQGGGSLIDIGTHALDLVLHLMGNYDVESVSGTSYQKFKNKKDTGNQWGNWDPEVFDVDDSSFGFIRMKNGSTVLLESSWCLNTLDSGVAEVTLCGTNAGADTRQGLRLNGDRNNELYTEVMEFKDEHANEIEARQWIESLKNNTPPYVTARQGLVVTRVLDAIYRSAETGKQIYLDD
ncbi:Gfo/Idh/MocA family oxidoreductase [Vibrio cholerae]